MSSSERRKVSAQKVFGVTMNKGCVAKIKDEERFSNWAWLPTLTPWFKSTVFAQSGIHISVLLLTVVCNLVYFTMRFAAERAAEMNGLNSDEVVWTSREIAIINDSISLLQRLMTWLVTGYVALIVNQYYRGAKEKGGLMFSSLARFVAGITPCISRDHPEAEEFREILWSAVNAMGYYALAQASKTTKFRLNKDELHDIFESRGMDSDYLLSLAEKETVTAIFNGIMKTLHEEMKKGPNGCLDSSFDSNRFVKVSLDLESLQEGSLRVVSSMSANKLPYAYHHLINWGVRNCLFVTTVFQYLTLAYEHMSLNKPMPFTCSSSIWTDPIHDCETEEYVVFQLLRMFTAYFVFGCLELYPTLAKTWEHSLVLENYRGVVDSICRPLKPGEEFLSLQEMRSAKTMKNTGGLLQLGTKIEGAQPSTYTKGSRRLSQLERQSMIQAVNESTM